MSKSPQLLAHESVLQLVSHKAWALLVALRLVHEKSMTAEKILTIIERLRVVLPVVGLLAEMEVKSSGRCSDELLAICAWLYDAAMRAMATLKTHDAPQADKDLPAEEDWRKVCLRAHPETG